MSPLASLAFAAALAQASGEPAAAAAPPPADRTPASATPAAGSPSAASTTGGGSTTREVPPLVDEIGHELRCPVCQGMPIAESPSEMAQAMMQRVHDLYAEGKSKQEIQQYFVERYGEWVLLRPEATGFNLLVWVLPPAALVLGLAGVGAYVRKTRRRSEGGPTGARAADAADDPYLRRVRQSVEEGEV